jgi:predicted nucleic acid-binding protein
MKNKYYYWDACVIITFLEKFNGASSKISDNGKKEREERLQKINAFYKSKKDNELLCTSVISKAEVLPSKYQYNKEINDILPKLWMPNNIIILGINNSIVNLAAEIRDNYNKQKPDIRIKLPDALHLATAIINNVAAFHTFDEKLLKCNEGEIVKSLKIVHPGESFSEKPDGPLFN